jgi:hypothetical protein
MESNFKVEIQYSDDLDTPTKELVQMQNRLEGLLANVKHPAGLYQFLTPIRDARKTTNSSISWWVWKGSTGRLRKRSFSASRFVFQLSRISENLVILLVRYRGNHDIYENVYLPKLRSGLISAQNPAHRSVASPKTIEKPTVIWTRPPVISRSNFPHTITESIKIPPSLDRNEVKECINNRLNKIIVAGNQHIRVTTKGNKTHLQVVGKSEQPYRAYDSTCLDNEERWNAVRSISKETALDPCLILSPEESEFLDKFTSEEFLPARIDGSAGSGKTTLLTITLANLIANRGKDFADLRDSPLFITYSATLRDDAKDRLRLYLIIHHDWSDSDARTMAERVCKTFSELIVEVLADGETSSQPTDKKNEPREWEHFRAWWNNGSGDSTFKRAGMNPADAYRAMRTYIFGYLPADVTATHEQRAEVFERLRKRNTRDITEADLTQIIDLWEMYRADHPNLETSSDRTIRAIDKIVANPNQFATWGHILCDEVQDLSDHDLRLLACLTHHSAIGKTNSASSNEYRSFKVVLPLILAGDEMQSVNPSGFTFVGCEEVFKEFASDLGYQFESMPKPLLLTENFRSLKSIVELGTACRQLHNSFDRDRTAPKITVHRKGEHAGQIARVEYTGIPNDSIKDLFKTDIAILIPCRTEEKAKYCQPNGELSKLLGIEEFNIGSLKTPEECKGIEYQTVVICGFGKAYEDAIKENRKSWTLNALSVAATRARDKIYFLDNKNHTKNIWNDLVERGKLESFPISKEIIEVSLDDQADFLDTELSTALCDDYGTATHLRDSKQQIENLKIKTDELLANTELPSDYIASLELNSKVAQSWLNYVNGDAIEDWKTLATYYNGKVWRRLIDDAIKNKRVEVLRAVTESASKTGTEDIDRIFQALCICFDAELVESDEQKALLNLCKRFDNLDNSGEKQSSYFSNLRSESVAGKHWKSIQETVIRSQFVWDPDFIEDILLHLNVFGISVPMMAVIHVRANITNKDVAFKKLEEYKGVLRASGSLHRTLLSEILAYHYGISWLSRVTIEKDVAPTLKAGSLDESLLFKALSHDLPRADTETNLKTVAALANSETSEMDQQSQNAKILAKASIRALVQHEATQLLNSLENAYSEIRSNNVTEGTENDN